MSRGGELSPATVAVTVVWATPDVQDVVALVLPAGATIAQAIAQSGLLAAHGVDRTAIRAAVRGRLKPPDTVLAAGDRVEITRPLRLDPKEARRRRAETKATGKRRRGR